MAVVPAIFEELCFRGFIFGALRTRLSALLTIVVSALLFGVFHEILYSGRLLPSTFLGLVLGWVRLRTRSVLPAILLHALNNGLLLTVAYYGNELQTRGWGVEENKHLPISWQALAVIGIIFGAGILVATTRAPSQTPNESPSIG
jgi:ABC-2 type transport system permease protein/sodium transport system permease protein